MRELCRVIGTELDLFVSKSSLHRILRSKDEIKNVKTTPKTTRTKIVSPIYQSFRHRLYEVCIAESHRTNIHNEHISIFGDKIRNEAIYKSDRVLSRLKFSKDWIQSYKKDFSLTYRRIVGKQFLVPLNEVEKCRAEIKTIMETYEPCNVLNFDESRFVPWASLNYGNFASSFATAKKYRYDDKMAYSTGGFISASGVSSLPIFISSSVPRNLFVDEKSKINNFEIIKTNGIVQKESARIFHVNHNGVDKEAIFMKSSRGWMTKISVQRIAL